MNEIGPPIDVSAPVDAIKPPRLNCAGICLHCGERDCDAAACLAWHAESCWMVCPKCDGEEWSEAYEPCGCMFGVVEACSAPAGKGRLAAV